MQDQHQQSADVSTPDRATDGDFVEVPAGLLPDGVVAVALVVRQGFSLYPLEEQAVKSAVPKRRNEFATGRECVRRALASLGHPYAPVPAGDDRVPVWPAGVTGSVAHSATLAIAVVCRCGTVRAIGIDIEPAVRLEPDLTAMFAAPGETPLPVSPELADSLRFSCKEAAFKCWFVAGGGCILEFHDMRLEASANGFVAAAPEPGPQRIQGRWALSRGHWWSAAWVL